jgi:hypothetical protein
MGIEPLTTGRCSAAGAPPLFFGYTWRRVRIHQLRPRTGTHCHYASRKCAEMRENPVKFRVFRTKSVVKFYLNGGFSIPVIRLFARLSVHVAPRSTHYPILNEASRSLVENNELIRIIATASNARLLHAHAFQRKTGDFPFILSTAPGFGKILAGRRAKTGLTTAMGAKLRREILPPPVRGIMAPDRSLTPWKM